MSLVCHVFHRVRKNKYTTCNKKGHGKWSQAPEIGHLMTTLGSQTCVLPVRKIELVHRSALRSKRVVPAIVYPALRNGYNDRPSNRESCSIRELLNDECHVVDGRKDGSMGQEFLRITLYNLGIVSFCLKEVVDTKRIIFVL